MKIKEKDGELVDIYSIYWINNKTIFLGLPKNYGGLRAYNAVDVSIIEPNLSGNFTFFEDGIYHSALIKEQLLDDLLELDETAYHRFLDILKAEGHIDPDFY